MKEITLKHNYIFYGDEIIGSYRQAYVDRFIPDFVDKWSWIYYMFDFHEGENGDEYFFKSKISESINKVFNCF